MKLSARPGSTVSVVIVYFVASAAGRTHVHNNSNQFEQRASTTSISSQLGRQEVRRGTSGLLEAVKSPKGEEKSVKGTVWQQMPQQKLSFVAKLHGLDKCPHGALEA